MALIRDESLSVGSGLIDEKHKELFKRYNELPVVSKNRRGREVILSMHDFLVEYVNEAFQRKRDVHAAVRFPRTGEALTAASKIVRARAGRFWRVKVRRWP